MSMIRICRVLAAVGLFACGLAAASTVRPLNIEQLTQHAGRIVAGRCTGVQVVRDARLGADVTIVTVRVDDVLKGTAAPTLAIRHVGGSGGAPGTTAVAGMPAIAPGQHVVLFLYPESASGLTSPVGLGQGRFVVAPDEKGRRLVVNDTGNRNLLRGLSPDARRRLGMDEKASPDAPALTLERLLEMVRRLAA